MMTNIFITIF